MANTLQSLFPFSTISQKNVQVYPCTVEFSAPLVAGHYVFDDVNTPPQVFSDLSQEQTGVIAGVMISANCSAEKFAAAVDEPLLLQVLNGSNNTPVNLKPFPFSQFSQGENYTLWFNITGSQTLYIDEFYLQLTGKIRQISGMTSNELKIKISFNFWRVDKGELTR